MVPSCRKTPFAPVSWTMWRTRMNWTTRCRAPAAERHLVVQFILVRHIVHETGANGVFRQEGTMIDQLAHFRFRLLPAGRDPLQQLLVEVAVQRLRHLAVRRRERPLGQLV